MQILLDTSIIIDYLRQKDKSKTLLYLFAHRQYKLYVSIVTYAESYAGRSIWERKEAMKILENLFSYIKILPLEEKISKKAGNISHINNLEIVDAIIAATALSHKLKLATLNVKDFKKIKGLKLFTQITLKSKEKV
ncbi:type II toxin-antitoxin system VapC family toxin [Candidatus Daviesbacteria bacterium]|nr:type II toxin-antitoxin system VapC family toxin [Candidatus Daviesbacteria bacterium]